LKREHAEREDRDLKKCFLILRHGSPPDAFEYCKNGPG
jgi:hypothetical protein